MKKRNIIIVLSIVVIIITLFVYKDDQPVPLNETIIDIRPLREYKNLEINWISGGKKYDPVDYWEEAVIREGWSLDGTGISISRFFQYSLLYRNRTRATLAFYLFSPNMVYRDKWPNFYHSSWNLTKEAGIKLNANRYIYYCGIGSKDGCQIWNYWAQYENYIVLFGFYDFGFGNSVDEWEQYISEIDKQFSDILDK